MKLIEDLGLMPYGSQGRNRRLGLYECPVCHNHFECRVDTVKSGYTTKCKSCADKSKVTKAASEFVDKAMTIHSDLYDYSLVEYTNSRVKIKIICTTHGVFKQSPNSHLNGHGCPHCATEAIGKAKFNKASLTFIDKARAVHGELYDYTAVEYLGARVKVTITCSAHGAFKQTPDNHLNGNGCPTCADTSKTTKHFIQDAKDIHGTLYDYSNAEYINSRTKVKINCSVHGVFEQTPNDHCNKGQGCPLCAKNGFDKSKSAILYYLKVTSSNIVTYKIGITNRSVEERFSNEERSRITIIKTWSYPLGAEAYDKEQQILKMYVDYKYTGEPLLSSGNTELFTADILGLDEGVKCR